MKVFKLSDEEVSCILTGLYLAHSKYSDTDVNNMLICDKLISLLDEDVEVFFENKNIKKEK